MIGVSTMDEHGYCCVSCDLQWEMESLYSADKIIFEVNPKIPHLPGECAVPVAMADVIIESDLDLYELQDPPSARLKRPLPSTLLRWFTMVTAFSLALVASLMPSGLN